MSRKLIVGILFVFVFECEHADEHHKHDATRLHGNTSVAERCTNEEIECRAGLILPAWAAPHQYPWLYPFQ
jgi:hypothetical protein